jgi:hypothetical protein
MTDDEVRGEKRKQVHVDLIARIIRRYYGWDKMPAPKETSEFLDEIKRRVPEVQPCANMDTELVAAVRREAEAIRQTAERRVRIEPEIAKFDLHLDLGAVAGGRKNGQ